MTHYRSNVRDQMFNLFELLDLENILAAGEFDDFDSETIRDMVTEAARLAEGPLAASFVESDRTAPIFDPVTHSVTLPENFKASVRAWIEAGWSKIGVHEGIGGVHAPAAVTVAVNEHLVGAHLCHGSSQARCPASATAELILSAFRMASTICGAFSPASSYCLAGAS